MAGITILGLGPGDPLQLTREAWEIINESEEIWLRTEHHPTIAGFPPSIKINSFDSIYESTDSFDKVYSDIVKEIIRLGQREQGVIYAVPGDPFIAETTGPEIKKQALLNGIELRIVNGLSFLEPTYAALGLDPFPQTTLMDAMELSQLSLPPFPIDKPVLITQIYSQLIAAEVKTTLNAFYSDDYEVILVHAAGTNNQLVEKVPLYMVDRNTHIGLLTNLFIPAMEEGYSIESFQEIVAKLRGPDGCPWDKAQTHQTLSQHLLEETYETLEAMEKNDYSHMAEEFGDLLLQIVLNAQIGCEESEFTMSDIVKGIYDKLIRRHPHVFDIDKVDGIPTVLKNWENIKLKERMDNGSKDKGLMDGVPSTLPALVQAQELQERAARVGFEWNNIEGVVEKIIEEVEELKKANNKDEFFDEIGDIFFTLVNFTRWKEGDAESALRRTNLKFRKRFSFLEKEVQKRGNQISDLSIDKLEEIWQQSKTV